MNAREELKLAHKQLHDTKRPQTAPTGSQELEKAQQAVESLKASQAESMKRFKEELEQAREELKLANRRAEEAKAAAEKERAALEKQLRDMTKEQTSEKAPQSGDVARLKVELQEARKINEDLERRLAETTQTVNSDVVDQLRRQYDERLQDMIQEKSQLSEELRGVTSVLESERVRWGGDGQAQKNAGPGEVVESEKINAEVARVQDMIAGIAQLIDNPETELSTVIARMSNARSWTPTSRESFSHSVAAKRCRNLVHASGFPTAAWSRFTAKR